MNPKMAEQFAHWHQQDLVNEADRQRLAAHARRSTNTSAPRGGGAPGWRREIGWVVIDLGAWLAGGYVEPAAGCN